LKLVESASFSYVSTHQIGSNNLNMAVSSNFDGREGPELLIPSSDFRSLLVIKYHGDQVEIINEFVLPGRLSTNIYLENTIIPSIWVGTDNGLIVNIL